MAQYASIGTFLQDNPYRAHQDPSTVLRAYYDATDARDAGMTMAEFADDVQYNQYQHDHDVDRDSEEISKGEDLTRGLKRGMLNVLQMAPEIANFIGRNYTSATNPDDPDNWLTNASDDMIDALEELKSSEELRSSYEAQEGFQAGKNLRWWLANIGEGVPSVAPALVSGGGAVAAARLAGMSRTGATIVGQLAGFGASSGQMLGEQAGETRRFEKESGKDVPWQEELKDGFIYSSVGGALEYAVPGFMLSKVLGKKSGMKIAARMKDIASKNPTVLGALTKGIATNFASEGTTEAMQQVLMNALQMEGYTFDESQKYTDGVIEAFAIGGAVGGVTMGPVSGGKDALDVMLNKSSVEKGETPPSEAPTTTTSAPVATDRDKLAAELGKSGTPPVSTKAPAGAAGKDFDARGQYDSNLLKALTKTPYSTVTAVVAPPFSPNDVDFSKMSLAQIKDRQPGVADELTALGVNTEEDLVKFRKEATAHLSGTGFDANAPVTPPVETPETETKTTAPISKVKKPEETVETGTNTQVAPTTLTITKDKVPENATLLHKRLVKLFNEVKGFPKDSTKYTGIQKKKVADYYATEKKIKDKQKGATKSTTPKKTGTDTKIVVKKGEGTKSSITGVPTSKLAPAQKKERKALLNKIVTKSEEVERLANIPEAERSEAETAELSSLYTKISEWESRVNQINEAAEAAEAPILSTKSGIKKKTNLGGVQETETDEAIKSFKYNQVKSPEARTTAVDKLTPLLDGLPVGKIVEYGGGGVNLADGVRNGFMKKMDHDTGDVYFQGDGDKRFTPSEVADRLIPAVNVNPKSVIARTQELERPAGIVTTNGVPYVNKAPLERAIKKGTITDQLQHPIENYEIRKLRDAIGKKHIYDLVLKKEHVEAGVVAGTEGDKRASKAARYKRMKAAKVVVDKAPSRTDLDNRVEYLATMIDEALDAVENFDFMDRRVVHLIGRGDAKHFKKVRDRRTAKHFINSAGRKQYQRIISGEPFLASIETQTPMEQIQQETRRITKMPHIERSIGKHEKRRHRLVNDREHLLFKVTRKQQEADKTERAGTRDNTFGDHDATMKSTGVTSYRVYAETEIDDIWNMFKAGDLSYREYRMSDNNLKVWVNEREGVLTKTNEPRYPDARTVKIERDFSGTNYSFDEYESEGSKKDTFNLVAFMQNFDEQVDKLREIFRTEDIKQEVDNKIPDLLGRLVDIETLKFNTEEVLTRTRSGSGFTKESQTANPAVRGLDSSSVAGAYFEVEDGVYRLDEATVAETVVRNIENEDLLNDIWEGLNEAEKVEISKRARTSLENLEIEMLSGFSAVIDELAGNKKRKAVETSAMLNIMIGEGLTIDGVVKRQSMYNEVWEALKGEREWLHKYIIAVKNGEETRDFSFMLKQAQLEESISKYPEIFDHLDDGGSFELQKDLSKELNKGAIRYKAKKRPIGLPLRRNEMGEMSQSPNDMAAWIVKSPANSKAYTKWIKDSMNAYKNFQAARRKDPSRRVYDQHTSDKEYYDYITAVTEQRENDIFGKEKDLKKQVKHDKDSTSPLHEDEFTGGVNYQRRLLQSITPVVGKKVAKETIAFLRGNRGALSRMRTKFETGEHTAEDLIKDMLNTLSGTTHETVDIVKWEEGKEPTVVKEKDSNQTKRMIAKTHHLVEYNKMFSTMKILSEKFGGSMHKTKVLVDPTLSQIMELDADKATITAMQLKDNLRNADRIDNDGESSTRSHMHGMDRGLLERSFYDPTNDVLVLAATEFSETPSIIFHELKHSMTSKWMQQNSDHVLVKDLERLMERAREFAVKGIRKEKEVSPFMDVTPHGYYQPSAKGFTGFDPMYTKTYAHIQALQKLDGELQPREFLAELGVNSDLQELLDAMPGGTYSPETGLLESILDLIKRVLNNIMEIMGVRGDTALADALNISTRIMTEANKETLQTQPLKYGRDQAKSELAVNKATIASFIDRDSPLEAIKFVQGKLPLLTVEGDSTIGKPELKALLNRIISNPRAYDTYQGVLFGVVGKRKGIDNLIVGKDAVPIQEHVTQTFAHDSKVLLVNTKNVVEDNDEILKGKDIRARDPKAKQKFLGVTKIISGGQTGADIAGLRAAKGLGMATGGVAPLGFNTQDGVNLNLEKKYKLSQADFDPKATNQYEGRTKQNVDDADATIAFHFDEGVGRRTGGTVKTIGYAKSGIWEDPLNMSSSTTGHRPVLVITRNNEHNAVALIQEFVLKNNIRTLNIAGNSKKKSPHIEAAVEDIITKALNVSGPAAITQKLKGQQPLSTKIERKVREIRRNKIIIKLDADKNGYTNLHSGKKYKRVSDFISDEAIPDNVYVKSATTIGTNLDIVARDVFEGSVKGYSKYVNSDGTPFFKSAEVFSTYVKQIKQLKVDMKRRGEYAIARDVVLYNDEIGVAGEVDLLTYDADGNFNIYDFKTIRTPENYGKSWKGKKSSRAKHTDQLSVYRILLNNTHRVPVNNIEIVPIKVSYFEGLKQEEVLKNNVVVGTTSDADVRENIPLKAKNKVKTAVINKLAPDYAPQRAAVWVPTKENVLKAAGLPQNATIEEYIKALEKLDTTGITEVYHNIAVTLLRKYKKISNDTLVFGGREAYTDAMGLSVTPDFNSSDIPTVAIDVEVHETYRDIYGTLIHEMSHGITQDFIIDNPTHQSVKALRRTMRRAHRVAKKTLTAEQYAYHKNIGSFVNVHEFVAEVLGSPQMQSFLKSVPSSGKNNRTLLDDVVQMVKKIVGNLFEGPEVSLLEEALDRSFNLMNVSEKTALSYAKPRSFTVDKAPIQNYSVEEMVAFINAASIKQHGINPKLHYDGAKDFGKDAKGNLLIVHGFTCKRGKKNSPSFSTMDESPGGVLDAFNDIANQWDDKQFKAVQLEDTHETGRMGTTQGRTEIESTGSGTQQSQESSTEEENTGEDKQTKDGSLKVDKAFAREPVVNPKSEEAPTSERTIATDNTVEYPELTREEKIAHLSEFGESAYGLDKASVAKLQEKIRFDVVMNDEAIEARRAEVQKNLHSTHKELDTVGKKYYKRSAIAKRMFDWQSMSLTPERLVTMLTGFKKNTHMEKFMVNAADIAKENELTWVQSRREAFNEVAKDAGVDIDVLQAADKVETVPGKTRSKFELMFMYAAMDNEQQRYVMEKKNLSHRAVDKREYKMLQGDSLLTAGEKKLALYMQKDLENQFDRLSDMLKQVLRVVTVKDKELTKQEKELLAKVLHEYQFFMQVGGYMPMINSRKVANRNIIEDVVGIMGGSMSNSKLLDVKTNWVYERGENGLQAINMNIMDVWNSTMQSQEHFMSHAEPVAMMRDLWFGKPFTKARGESLDQRVSEQFGEGMSIAMNSYFNSLAQPFAHHTHDMISNMAKGVMRHSALAYLGFNVVTAGKQWPSLVFFLRNTDIPTLFMTLTKAFTGGLGELKAFVQEDVQMANRHQALDEALSALDRKDFQQHMSDKMFRKLGMTGPKARKFIKDSAMMMIKKSDSIVTTIGYAAVYKTELAKAEGAGLSGDEAVQKARQEARKAVFASQPASDVKNVPLLYRSSDLGKTFLLFTNQLNKIYNMWSHEIVYKSARQGKMDKGAIELSILLAIAGTGIGMVGAGGKWPDDPDEDFFMEWVNMMGTNLASSIPFVGSALSAVYSGYVPPPNPLIAAPLRAAEGIKYSYKATIGAKVRNDFGIDPEQARRAAKRITEVLGIGFGLPGHTAGWRAYENLVEVEHRSLIRTAISPVLGGKPTYSEEEDLQHLIQDYVNTREKEKGDSKITEARFKVRTLKSEYDSLSTTHGRRKQIKKELVKWRYKLKADKKKSKIEGLFNTWHLDTRLLNKMIRMTSPE